MSRYFAVQATFAEIPGVLETGTIRKIDRRYPFNDACQWFIDHADLIILVYDYAKLDIGPETEALLDQLKGRESQVTRLVFILQHYAFRICLTISKIKVVPKIQLRKMDYCYERKCCLFHPTPKSFANNLFLDEKFVSRMQLFVTFSLFLLTSASGQNLIMTLVPGEDCPQQS